MEEQRHNYVSINAPVATCLMFIRHALKDIPKMNKAPYWHVRPIIRILNDDNFLKENTETDPERGERKRINRIADYIDTIPKEERKAIFITEIMKCIIDYYEKTAQASSRISIAEFNNPLRTLSFDNDDE